MAILLNLVATSYLAAETQPSRCRMAGPDVPCSYPETSGCADSVDASDCLSKSSILRTSHRSSTLSCLIHTSHATKYDGRF